MVLKHEYLVSRARPQVRVQSTHAKCKIHLTFLKYKNNKNTN